MRISVLLAAVLLAGCAPEVEDHPPIIPLPAAIRAFDGSYTIEDHPEIEATGEAIGAAELLAAELGRLTGSEVEIGRSRSSVQIRVNGEGPAESYRLEVRMGGIEIDAADAAGAFYAVQTLRQLFVTGPTLRGSVEVPYVTIEDTPRFPYRGLQLDVGRHFFDVEFIKKYLDLMARYKLNTFHWHLTEDQGWRIEIDAFPRLTEVGSCRSETIVEKNFNPFVGDATPYCGFYTKDQIREVVAYAAERHITVIPEIEMPGHASAALAAYPEYGCTGGPYEVSTIWGIHDDIFCPSEETFQFLETVLAEVIELFPSEFIHIGADEVPKGQWEQSEVAQAVMAREGLEDEHELQSWFIRRIERFLNANGKRLIGWDEILEGGLAPNATVMSWRGTEGGIAAARQGHDVVMTPTRHLYFDFYQGPKESEPISADWSGYPLPLEQVYAFDPVPSELSAEEAVHILGAQGNVWTEYMKTPDKVEYMVIPRALALAEMAWTPQEDRDFEAFLQRLPSELRRLGDAGYRYRPLDTP